MSYDAAAQANLQTWAGQMTFTHDVLLLRVAPPSHDAARTPDEHPHRRPGRPGSMYLPIERFEVDGLGVAVLEELKDQMRASIREARGRHTVADLGPGKFAGPLT